jgi:hypothetical protein
MKMSRERNSPKGTQISQKQSVMLKREIERERERDRERGEGEKDGEGDYFMPKFNRRKKIGKKEVESRVEGNNKEHRND